MDTMKLTEFIVGVGRPVAYYPKLRIITGSTNATILLCQLLYWIGKERYTGEIFKTSEEITEETGLSYKEQKTARKNLIDNGLLEERYARLEHQIYYKPLLKAIDEKWRMTQQAIPESPDGTFGNDPSGCSLNSNTETTAEITHEIKSEEQASQESDLEIEPVHYFTEKVAEKIVTALTGWATIPSSNYHEIVRLLEAIYNRNDRDFDRTVADIKKYQASWETRRTKEGNFYRKANLLGYLEWCLTNELPPVAGEVREMTPEQRMADLVRRTSA
jgi:hypothetical protein